MPDFRAAVPNQTTFVPDARIRGEERIPKLRLRIGEVADVKLWGKRANGTALALSDTGILELLGDIVDDHDSFIRLLRFKATEEGKTTLAAQDGPADAPIDQAHLDIEVLPPPEPMGPPPAPPPQPPAPPKPALPARPVNDTEGDGQCLIMRSLDFATVSAGAKIRYWLDYPPMMPAMSQRNPHWFVEFEPGSGQSWIERLIDSDTGNSRAGGHGTACVVLWQRPGVHKIRCVLQNPPQAYSRRQIVRPLDEMSRQAFAATDPSKPDPFREIVAARASAAHLKKDLTRPNPGTPAGVQAAQDEIDRLQKWANDVEAVVKDCEGSQRFLIKATSFIAEYSQSVELRIFFVRLDARRFRLVDYTDPTLNHSSRKVYEVSSSDQIEAEEALSQLLYDWENENRYYAGEVRYELAAIPSEGIDARSGTFTPVGKDRIERIAEYLAIASTGALVVASLGTALLPVATAGTFAANAMLFSLVAGIGSGALSTFSRIRYDEQTVKDTVFDVVQVAALLLPIGGAYWARGARVLNLSGFVGASNLETAVFYGTITANRVNGMLISANLADKLSNILNSSTIDPVERKQMLFDLLHSAVDAGLILTIPHQPTERALKNARDAVLTSQLSRLLKTTDEIVLKETPGQTHAVDGEHVRRVDTGNEKKAGGVARPGTTVADPASKTLREWAKTRTQDILARAHQAQPPIRAKLEQLAAKHDGEMAGLKYEFKGEDSLERKIHDESQRRLGGAAAEGDPARIASLVTANSVNDSLRYTIVLPIDGYYGSARAIIAELHAAGYQKKWMKDFWAKEGQPGDTGYRGINATFANADGFQFELQFQTQESFDLKSATHADYEERRKPETPPARVKELIEKNIMLSSKLHRPPGGPL